MKPTTCILAAALLAALSLEQPGVAAAAEWQSKVDARVLDTATSAGAAEVLIVLAEQADLSPAQALRGQRAKGQAVVAALRATAERSQAPLRELLRARGAAHRPLWVANLIWAEADRSLIEELAARPDVRRIAANPRVRMRPPRREKQLSGGAAVAGIEWGVQKIEAPQAWNAGIDGSGIVIGGQDTGYQWTHPAIRDRYRGWDGSAAHHDHNWHDAIHTVRGGNLCGTNAQAPCDDGNHGTHTMGTMLGRDGANQIGVAPGARWIGCRNMDNGVGTPATYAECFQWFLAPTDLAGGRADPNLAPQVINNSWGCPPSEGCTDPGVLRNVVDNVRAAGIVVVVSAGNEGPSCGSVAAPPAIYDSAFSVGATGQADQVASFSSRGPVTVDGSQRLKPDVSAPGQGVRSSVPGNGYDSFSGTSMAGPHVVGVVALLLQAHPELDGNVDRIEQIIRDTAAPLSNNEDCASRAGLIPNAVFGHGRVNAWLAVTATGGGSYSDEFEDGVRTGDWNYKGNTWRESGGALTAKGGEAWAQRAFAGCSDCTVEATVAAAPGQGGYIALVGWRRDAQHWVELRLGETENRWTLVQKDGARTKQAKFSTTIAADTPYDLRVSFDGARFTVDIGGTRRITLAKLPGSNPTGTVGFKVNRRTARFDRIAAN